MADFDIYTVKEPTRPTGMPLHFLYALLYGFGVISALWQIGHPILVLSVIICIIPLSLLVYVPYKYFSDFYRSIVQGLIIGAGIFWFVYRTSNGISIDIMLVEFFAILGLALFVQSRTKEYPIKILITVIMFIYGAHFPRHIFLNLLPFAFILVIILMFKSRTYSLTKSQNHPPPANRMKKNWQYLILYIIISSFLCGYIYSVMPKNIDVSNRGFMPVAFSNNNKDYIPPTLSDWFKPKIVHSPNGTLTIPGTKAQYKSKIGPIVNDPESKGEMSPSGNGSSPPGDDLVFKVKSPIKQYWLGQLYDFYNGGKWITTEKFKKQKSRFSPLIKYYSVSQYFILNKWYSRVLYSGFRGGAFLTEYNLKLENTYFNARIDDETDLPQIPFNYRVSSLIPNFNPNEFNKKYDLSNYSYWTDQINKNHFLRLPNKAKSSRLRELVKIITRDKKSDYDKAIALRDFLRNNFKYEQMSQPTPQGKESTDYFVFVLKKGHCEYFASALAVMARLARIPSRVATGFSPGDYDSLSGYFNVYEYHAHAWTQLFIKGKGWLTFDATPSGSVISKTYPYTLGLLNDPFGDEWRIRPPEMTSYTQNFIKKQIEEFKRSAKEMENMSEFYDIVMKIPVNKEEFNQTVSTFRNTVSQRMKKKGISPEIMIKDIKEKLRAMFNNIAVSLSRFVIWILGINGIRIFVVVVILFSTWYTYPLTKSYFNRKKRIKKCEKWYEEAKLKLKADPDFAVSSFYRMSRELLNLSGLPRTRNIDLNEYASSLNKVNRDLSEDIRYIFELYTRISYSPRDASSKDATKALKHIRKITDFLLERIRQSEILRIG